MNQEIEYAEMLEIPVSTVNVVRKKRRKKQEIPVKNAVQSLNQSALAPAPAPISAPISAPVAERAPDLSNQPLKDTVIAQINERVEEEKAPAPQQLEISYASAEEIQTEGALRLDPVPERIDTVRLYAEDELRDFRRNKLNKDEAKNQDEKENEATRYALNKEKHQPKAVRIALGIEFAAACVLCGAIFFTNVFMPNSAINTFFHGVTNGGSTDSAVNRVYLDFELSPIVSELSNVTLNLSQTGVLSFTDECCVYPAADGEVAETGTPKEIFENPKTDKLKAFLKKND